MSRSFKKSPCCTEQAYKHNVWYDKRLANKAVRNAVDVPNGKAYRKYYQSWDICDYMFRKSYNEWFLRNFRRPDHFRYGGYESYKDVIEGNTLNEWEKWYRRK